MIFEIKFKCFTIKKNKTQVNKLRINVNQAAKYGSMISLKHTGAVVVKTKLQSAGAPSPTPPKLMVVLHEFEKRKAETFSNSKKVVLFFCIAVKYTLLKFLQYVSTQGLLNSAHILINVLRDNASCYGGHVLYVLFLISEIQLQAVAKINIAVM